MAYVEITKEEQSAIRSLQRLARKWPKSLSLFSWSGSLQITKEDSNGMQAIVDGVEGISNDGGDPDRNQINQDAEILWP